MSDCMVVSKVSLVCLSSECLSFLLEDTASTVLSLHGYDTQLKSWGPRAPSGHLTPGSDAYDLPWALPSFLAV